MKVRVYLLHFGRGKIRTVTIPNSTSASDFLDRVFHYGQNEVQPLPLPSVSVGDVIENPHDGRLYRVEMTGFKPLPESGGPYISNPARGNPGEEYTEEWYKKWGEWHTWQAKLHAARMAAGENETDSLMRSVRDFNAINKVLKDQKLDIGSWGQTGSDPATWGLPRANPARRNPMGWAITVSDEEISLDPEDYDRGVFSVCRCSSGAQCESCGEDIGGTLDKKNRQVICECGELYKLFRTEHCVDDSDDDDSDDDDNDENMRNPDTSLREIERQLQLEPKNHELRARYRRMCVRSGVPELAGFEIGDLVEVTLNPNYLDDDNHSVIKLLSFKAVITNPAMYRTKSKKFPQLIIGVKPLEYIWNRCPPSPGNWDQDPDGYGIVFSLIHDLPVVCRGPRGAIHHEVKLLVPNYCPAEALVNLWEMAQKLGLPRLGPDVIDDDGILVLDDSPLDWY